MSRTLGGQSDKMLSRADKPALRARYLAARAAVPEPVRAADDSARDLLLNGLLGGRVAAYVSFGTEPATYGLVQPTTLVPVLRPDGDLDWRLAGGGPLLGVDALAGCDVVLVPALAVDRRGVRLGRGGGSYDRALRRTHAAVVALLHADELVAELPEEPHDVRVDAVALPSGIVSVGRRTFGR